MADVNISNDDKQSIEVKLVSFIRNLTQRFLSNPEKTESVLKAFATYVIKQHKQSVVNNQDSSILTLFKQAISDGIKSKESYALANQIGQILLDEATKEQKRFPNENVDGSTTDQTSEQNLHGQFTRMCTIIKVIFEKISTLLFDQETVTQLLKMIFDRVSNETEISLSFYENVNQLLKVFIQHPFIFNASESLDFLWDLLKQRVLELAPILLRIIEGCAPLIIENHQNDMLSVLRSELSSYLTFHPPIAKRALYCLCAFHPNEKDRILQKIIDNTQYDQFDNDQFVTRLVLLGHSVALCPEILANCGKRILSSVSKYIIDKQSINNNEDQETMTSSFLHEHFTLLPDEPHADPDIGGDTRVKRELIKAMSRAIIGLKENSGSLFIVTYKLIRKSIQQDQDFTGDMSENEIVYIRLCGLSCLLKLISNNYFYTRIKPDDFLLIMTLLRDPSSIIRQRTYRKLAENLRDPLCPIELLALLAFAAKEPEREHREQIRRLMLQIIDTRREHIKLQLSYKTANSNRGFDFETIDHHDDKSSSINEEKPIDYTLYPEYSLTYFIFFLSKSPAFILYDDIEMLHTMTDYMLFLLDALLQRCDATVGLFYKGLLRSIKSSEDATISPDKEEKAERRDAVKKLHVLVDLTYVILSQRASSLMICRASSDVPLPELYFKKTRYNHLSYLPKDFKIRLKPLTSATVTDVSAIGKRANLNQCETPASTTSNIIEIKSVSAKATRRKRKSTENDGDQLNDGPLNKKRRSLPPIISKCQRDSSNDSDENDQQLKSNLPNTNVNHPKQSSSTEFGQQKRQIRFVSSSSSSST